MTAQIAQTEQALGTAQAAVEKKQKELQSLQKQTKEQRTAALTVQEIRSMGKKTITGNITLTHPSAAHSRIMRSMGFLQGGKQPFGRKTAKRTKKCRCLETAI